MPTFVSTSIVTAPRRRRNRCCAWCLAVLCCFAAGGCGDGNLVPVHGSVKKEGQILSGGSVVFMPVGEGKPAFGPIQPDGSFQLSTHALNDGAMIGQYQVSVAGERNAETERTEPTYIGPAELLLEVAAEENKFQIHIRKRDGWQEAVGG